MSSKNCDVVPETPEASKVCRRSSRRSTIANTKTTFAYSKHIAATPDPDSPKKDRQSRTLISESPYSQLNGSPMNDLSKRAADLGISSESPIIKSTKNHPMFNCKKRGGSQILVDDAFEEFVPATQDPGSLTPKSKVQAWLTNENQSPVFNTTKLQNAKKRRKSVAGISKVLLERPSGNNSSNQNASTDNEDISLELAKILAKDDKQQSTESTPEFLQQAIDEHEPYRPPSFQNYSSDSAKALLAKYEAGKTSIGSIGSGPKLSDSDQLPTQSAKCRKTRSLEAPSTASTSGTPKEIVADSENSTEKSNRSPPKCRKTRSLEPASSLSAKSLTSNILEGVKAYVEVRSKNENRSDVVISQLLALGARVEPKLGVKCTHVIFKEGSLTTYTKAKKIGVFIVSVSWVDACKKEAKKLDEANYPPMNFEKYESPGLFPKLRKGKSLQPKSDEEFAKMIEAKTKRIMKKKLAAADSPIPGTPKQKLKIPRRRRSCILETLKEYEDLERESPTVTPGSPCSSEEMNTPLLRRIAQRLFKNNQNAETSTPNDPQESSPVLKETLNQFEISNDGFSNDKDSFATTATTSKETNNKDESSKNVEKPAKQNAVPSIFTPKLPKTLPKSKTMPRLTSVTSPKKRPKKSVSKAQAAKSSRKKKLYTQNSVLSETAAETPEIPVTQQNTKSRKGKTKIVKKGSIIIATTVTKENLPPPSAAGPSCAPKKASKDISFKKPLSVQNNTQPAKRILRSMEKSRRSSLDFVEPAPWSVIQPSQQSKKANNSKATLILPMKEFVMTSCTPEDTHLAKELTKTLSGKAKVALRISPTTTHVICGEERRTLNMLKAILLGCWIVSKSWLLACLEGQGWVDEEPYELVNFSAAVKARRIDREAAMMTKSNLLCDIGPIYIGRLCKVPRNELLELIKLAGGTSANQMKKAEVILGHVFIENTGATQVMEKWLLDSIQQHCPLPFTDYPSSRLSISY